MSFTPPTVDELGNIHIHGRDELRLSVTAMIGDEAEDLSERVLVFETDSGIRVALEDDPNEPTGRLLVLSRKQIRLIPNTGAYFSLIDETDPDSYVRWDGRIRWRGYAK